MSDTNKYWNYVLGGIIILVVVIYLYKKNRKLPLVSNKTHISSIKINQTQLLATMNKLWTEHIMYTALLMFSSFHDLPNADAFAVRLLGNQDDIGNSIKQFYGEVAGEAFAKLLREHILYVNDIIRALKQTTVQSFREQNETNVLRVSISQLYNNADQITGFLVTANPYFKTKDVRKMMYEHLKYTTREILAYHHGLWNEQIVSLDKVIEQAFNMAKMISEGISKQFNLQ